MKKMIFPVVAVLLASCNPSDKQTTQQTAETQTETATTETAPSADSLQVDGITGATNVANASTFNGTLVIPPQHFAAITLPMGGIVKNLSLLPGTYVQKGKVLATLENPEFITLQQEYLDSRAHLEYLEAEYHRQQTLSQEEAASQKKLQQSKADYLSMKSRMQAAVAQLQLLGIQPEKLVGHGISPSLEIKAPISGYVSNLQANLGKFLDAGEPLCEIIDKSRMMVRLVAYEKDLENLEVGCPLLFHINGLGNTTFHGKLIAIGQEVDDTNRSIELYAEVTENNPLFRPGMYVSARMGKE